MLAISLAAATVPGFAASLGGLTGTKLGAGNAVVAACDANGFAATYTTAAGSVTAVTLSGIADPGCETGQLSLTLADASGAAVASEGPLTIPVDVDVFDNTLVVDVIPSPLASLVKAVHVTVTGP
ncbi:hypothetical protein BH20ACT16_BH20ACT16_09460 [soil metagenome]